MTQKSFKNLFAASALLCLCLASALAFVLWRHWMPIPSQPDAGPVVARGPEASAQNGGNNKPQPVTSQEPALAPIPMSPQRMQEIGVTTAIAEMKEVSDQL